MGHHAPGGQNVAQGEGQVKAALLAMAEVLAVMAALAFAMAFGAAGTAVLLWIASGALR